jgi:hypothetical protein
MDGYNDRALTTQKPQPSNSSHDTDRAIAGLIARLLLHFWTPQELSEGARTAMASDWLMDVREFGSDVVAEACGRWRRSETRRPTIADIRRLCIEEQGESHMAIALVLSERGLVDRLREEHQGMRRVRDEDAAQHREDWAHQLGYKSFRQMLDIGLVAAVRNAPAYRL